MLLRVLEILGGLPQSAIRLLRARFMSLARQVLALTEEVKSTGVNVICVSILAVMIDEMELNLSRVIAEL